MFNVAFSPKYQGKNGGNGLFESAVRKLGFFLQLTYMIIKTLFFFIESPKALKHLNEGLLQFTGNTWTSKGVKLT